MAFDVSKNLSSWRPLKFLSSHSTAEAAALSPWSVGQLSIMCHPGPDLNLCLAYTRARQYELLLNLKDSSQKAAMKLQVPLLTAQ